MKRLDQLIILLEANPTDIFLKYAYALELKSQGDMDLAISALKTLNEESPEYLPIYYQLGSWLAETGESETALKYLRGGKLLAFKQMNIKTVSEIQSLIDDLED